MGRFEGDGHKEKLLSAVESRCASSVFYYTGKPLKKQEEAKIFS
jgi:hypothetical protein